MAPSSICSNCGNDALAGLVVDVPVSPVPNILKHNQPPSAMESALAHTAITDIGPDLHRLEDEVTRVRSILDQLTRCCDALRNFRHAHEGALSSIRKLPAETLGRIFVESLPEFFEPIVPASSRRQWRSMKHYRETISNLGQVCKYWRDVNITTPEIWSRISLEGLRVIQADKVDQWLQRSGEIPLGIICPDLSELPPSLSACTHRWEDVHLRVVDRSHWHTFVPHFHQAPLLHTLYLEFLRDDGSVEDQGLDWTIKIDAPLLRHFALRIDDPVVSLPFMQIPYPQLTSLSLQLAGAPASQLIIEILSNTINLIHCSLHFYDFGADQPGSDSVPSQSLIHLPSLRCLDIDGGGAAMLLYHLVAPALREFKYHGDLTTGPFNALPSLVTRSSCSIEKLAMTFLGVAEERNIGEEFLQILELAPNLISLDLGVDCIISEPLIHRLNPNSSHDLCLNPRLQHLKSIAPRSLPEIQLLVDMIVARFDPAITHSTPLGHFTVIETVTLTQNEWYSPNGTGVPEDVDTVRLSAGERLATLKANGMKLITSNSYGQEVPAEEIFFNERSVGYDYQY